MHPVFAHAEGAGLRGPSGVGGRHQICPVSPFVWLSCPSWGDVPATSHPCVGFAALQYLTCKLDVRFSAS